MGHGVRGQDRAAALPLGSPSASVRARTVRPTSVLVSCPPGWSGIVCWRKLHGKRRGSHRELSGRAPMRHLRPETSLAFVMLAMWFPGPEVWGTAEQLRAFLMTRGLRDP